MARAGGLVAGLLLSGAALAQAPGSPEALLAEAEKIYSREPERAEALVDSALASLDPARDLPLWLSAQGQKCWLITYAEPERALALVVDASRYLDAATPNPASGQLRVCAGYAHERLDQIPDAAAAYEEGVEIGRATQDQPLLAKALALRGELHYVRGAYSEALVDLKAAYEAATASASARDRAYILNAIANLYGGAGEYDRAIQYYQQTLRLGREQGRESDAANAMYNIGVTYDKLGRHAEALTQYQQVLEIYEKKDDAHEIASTLRSMAISLIKSSRPEQALVRIDRAREVAGDGDAELTAAICLTRGSALRALNRAAEALPELDKAWAWFEPADAKPFLEKILDERAQVFDDNYLGRSTTTILAG